MCLAEFHAVYLLYMPGVARDLRYGARQLLANPAFTLVAILSLALGIGANTAIFQLLNAVRLRSLPVKAANELVEIKIVGGNGGMGLVDSYDDLTRPIFEELRRSHPAFSGVLAWSPDGRIPIGEGSDLQFVNGITVSGEFFGVLGVEPWRGRLISPDDEHACPESVAVLGYDFWKSRLGGREIDANTTLVINGQRRQIIGVTPPSFFGLEVGDRFDVAVPFCRPRQLARNVFDVSVFGRLQPGWTSAAASAQLAAASPAIMAATEITGYDPSSVQAYRNFHLGAYSAASGISDLRKTYDRSLWLLLAITGLVLLIACSNLANLMLARAGAREREMAVRMALGAPRVRLLRQLLVESSLLAAIGATLGVGLAELLSRALLLALSTEGNPVSLVTGTDWRVLLFTAAVAGLTCIVFGLVPSLRASGVDPVAAINAGGRAMTAGRERFSIQRAMGVTQIAVSLVLVVGALLFVRSFHNLMTFDPGMREEGIAVAYVEFRKSNITRERILQFQRELLDEIRSAPGVLSAATTTHVPLVGGSWTHIVTIGNAEGSPRFAWVSPGYFQTMGIPIVSGRDFLPTDTGSSQHVAIVNQAFVRSLLNGANPIGLTLRTHPEPDFPATDYQIVGVIPDTKYNDLRGETPPMTFAPQSQFPNPEPFTAIMIRTATPPSAAINVLKRALAEKHPEIVATFGVFQQQVRDGLVRERLMAMLSGFFGALAALLGMVGLYGVISYIVGSRRNEIGIRLALGASRGQVVGMVMREAGLLLLVGVVFGTALSLVAARAAESLLFGLKPYDALTLVAAAGLLAAIGAIGSFMPAHRASKLDPMAALRCE
jgi:predicted permease